MSWRDRRGSAKFRGVPFFVDTTEVSGGRRGVTHEYPLRDEPFVEDMGRKARTFPVEGYVIGEDYLAARDALQAALETGGPGELVHPTHGTRRVLALEFRIRESRDEGGMARFSITFAETAAHPTQPTVSIDASGALRGSASVARDSVGAEFRSKYAPAALLDSVVNSLAQAALAIRKSLSGLTLDAQKRASFGAQADSFASSISSLVHHADGVVDAVSGLVESFEARVALLEVYAYNPGVRPPATTVNRRQEQANFDAVLRLIQRLVVIRAAELTLSEVFRSYDEAIAAREVIAGLIDDQAEIAADDTYPALLQLRADLVKAVPDRDRDLAHLLRYTPVTTLPSLVLAHRLYGNLDLEGDLVARNQVPHPGFVIGGREIEVLSRG